MPNQSYDLAFQEAAALADTANVILDTIEIHHESVGSIFMVNDRDPLTRTLEDGLTVVEFEAINFGLKLPDSTSEGVQYLSLTLNNTDQRITDFLNAVDANLSREVTITHRFYITPGLTSEVPSNDPPSVLYLTDVELDVFQAKGKAGFRAIVNSKYPNEYYTSDRFPTISN